MRTTGFHGGGSLSCSYSHALQTRLTVRLRGEACCAICQPRVLVLTRLSGWTEKLDGAWRRWLLNLILGNNQRGWGERKTRLDHVELMDDILYILSAHVDVNTELRFDLIIRTLIEWRSHFLNPFPAPENAELSVPRV